MCLILLALRRHPDYPLIVAANRDEFYARPTAKAQFWDDEPELLAGRDLQAGGTWLGINRSGEFSAVTNFRDAASSNKPASRGELTRQYLSGAPSTDHYIQKLIPTEQNFNGFNLLVGTPERLAYHSNKGRSEVNLAAGIYGLSNALLDDAWPKVQQGKQQLTTIIEQHSNCAALTQELFALLADPRQAAEHDLPDTGISLEWEQKLSSRFIESESYGTRASTIVLFHKDGRIDFFERSFGPGQEPSDNHYQL